MVALLFSRLPEFSEEAHSIDDAGSVIDQVSGWVGVCVCVCVCGVWSMGDNSILDLCIDIT